MTVVKGHSEPNKNCFDRQTGPRSDVQPYQVTRPVFPPTVGQRERRFPEQTDQQKQEKRKTECTPINEWPRTLKKPSRRNQGSAHEVNEIPRKAFRRAGQKLLIQNRSSDQRNAEHH